MGLDKLRETQAGVEDMQKGLAEKERHLRYSHAMVILVATGISALYDSQV